MNLGWTDETVLKSAQCFHIYINGADFEQDLTRVTRQQVKQTSNVTRFNDKWQTKTSDAVADNSN